MGFVDFKGQVILACGGFEASARLRRQYLGEGWDMVVVRGIRFNTGKMLEKVIAARAGSVGQWGGSCEFAGPRRAMGWGSKCQRPHKSVLVSLFGHGEPRRKAVHGRRRESLWADVCEDWRGDWVAAGREGVSGL
jgi:hypothetical protein